MGEGDRGEGPYSDDADSVVEGGLGFAGDLTKPDFIGKSAVLEKKAAGIRKKLVQVLVKAPEPLLFHAEVVRRDGVEMGYVRAASYGHTLGGAVGLAMIERAAEPITEEWLRAGTWDVEIAGARYPMVASLKPMYDPAMERIRA